ncbi:hypothetical protein [Gemelliphila palaticanis]|uniref:Uncharacterized protein n=1 Tax=Gemelliphila palaticanis TaxID=81950 RepID=A0ABX2SXA6_9BACL|nr:hypothetical protein [Gemella palaticanis]MBF0714920.1 hypothetical protein [Gemella palaticanis]NYS46850.1 hypothetical protein [Gemella palaticanis]
MKIYNYVCYFISSLIPLYFLFIANYTLFNIDVNKAIFYIICLLISFVLLIIIVYKRPTSIFVCNYKEILGCRKLNHKLNYLIILLYFYVFNELDFNIIILPIIYLAFILLLYKLDFKIENIVLYIFGFKKYIVRDKIVYSKKSIDEFSIEIKKNKYIQILEVNNNIYIEKKSYSMKKDYCM